VRGEGEKGKADRGEKPLPFPLPLSLPPVFQPSIATVRWGPPGLEKASRGEAVALVLYESRLTPQRAVYVPRVTISLG
jgi:hypothetical protein